MKKIPSPEWFASSVVSLPLNNSQIASSKLKDRKAIYRIFDSGVSAKGHYHCPTLMANMGTYPDRVPVILDDFGIRKITPYECLALQGFPKEYRFPKIPMASAYKQCGNSVVVLVIRRIAEQIKKVLYDFIVFCCVCPV